jgi:hypothetical protein
MSECGRNVGFVEECGEGRQFWVECAALEANDLGVGGFVNLQDMGCEWRSRLTYLDSLLQQQLMHRRSAIVCCSARKETTLARD